MGKIIQITEQQYSNLKQKMLLETNGNDFSDFKTNVEIEFETLNKEIDGRSIYGVEINDTKKEIDVLFDIEFELTKHGIRDASITNIKSDKTLDIIIELEPLDDDDDDNYYEHKLTVDWSIAEVIYDEGDGALPKSIERVVIVLDDSFFVEKILIYPYFN